MIRAEFVLPCIFEIDRRSPPGKGQWLKRGMGAEMQGASCTEQRAAANCDSELETVIVFTAVRHLENAFPGPSRRITPHI